MNDLTATTATTTLTLTFGNLLMFNNEVLHYLSIFGGLFSLFGTVIILMDDKFLGSDGVRLSKLAITLQLFKSIILGALSILLYFLTFKYIGGVMMYEQLNVILENDIIDTLSLVTATILSWFTTPIMKLLNDILVRR